MTVPGTEAADTKHPRASAGRETPILGAVPASGNFGEKAVNDGAALPVFWIFLAVLMLALLWTFVTLAAWVALAPFLVGFLAYLLLFCGDDAPLRRRRRKPKPSMFEDARPPVRLH